MTSYIALLRGVNVGGITIRSVELAEVFRGLGFAAVRTVLASGNVCFETVASDATDAAVLKARIEQALGDRFGYDAWIVLVTREHLDDVVRDFPFDAERGGWHPYVLFGSDQAALDALLATGPDLDPDDDVIVAGDGVIYWHNRRDVGVGSGFAKFTAKARFRSSTTTRNLRTLNKVLDGRA